MSLPKINWNTKDPIIWAQRTTFRHTTDALLLASVLYFTIAQPLLPTFSTTLLTPSGILSPLSLPKSLSPDNLINTNMQASPSIRRGDHRDSSRGRRRSSPSYESDRKRYRVRSRSPDPASRRRSYSQRSWDRETYEQSRRISSQHVSRRTPSYNTSYRGSYEPRASPRHYESGFQGPSNDINNAVAKNQPRTAFPAHHVPPQVSTKSRRLYIGNLPFHAGLNDIALTQFFSAMYIAAFRPNRPGEPLPVVSFWLHSDGKFGFMELRGEQEAVNMMQFNGIFLHGRPLRVNRPSDYRPEVHNPTGMNLVPEVVNIPAVMELCDKLGTVVTAPVQLAAIDASQATTEPIRKMTPPAYKDPVSTMPKESNYQNLQEKPSDWPSKTEPESEVAREPTKSDRKSPEPPLVSEATVISLKNLVTDEDLKADDEEYQEVVSDVQEECGKYGVVDGICIPKSGIWQGTAFVQFRESAAAKTAIEALGKRVYDGNRVVAIGLKGCKTASEAAERPQL